LIELNLGTRKEVVYPQADSGASYIYAQRPTGVFEHRIQIPKDVPKDVDLDAITASMQNGVLSLIVSRPEPAKPKRVAIGSQNKERQLEPATV
jgi:HSP20 family molecular chaperone IbpA